MPQLTKTELDEIIEGSARALTTIGPLLPTYESVQAVMEQTSKVSSRGYFLPDEDELVRTNFSNYLTTRAALVSVLEDLRTIVLADFKQPTPRHPEAFLIAFCTACMLIRSGRFMIDTFRKDGVFWRKLDEAEPRFGIPKKQFTQIYRSVTSNRNVAIFMEGIRYFHLHEAQFLALTSNPTLKPIVDLLQEEIPFIEKSTRYYLKHRLKYRLHSFLLRHHAGFRHVTFGVFKFSGSVLSEIRNQWKRKRVTPGVQRKVARMLEPGDVIITRHDDAATNLFLPGFWPHGSLYVGTEAQRKRIDPTGETWRDQCPDPKCVLEARKDDVRFRPINDTLKVDALVVLRPKLTTEQIREGIARAMTHEGKPYDFEFDFRRSNKIVCTEVIYRAFHGVGDFEFELKPRSGRLTLSAEDLLDYAVNGRFFDVLVVYGSNGNRFVTGERAMSTLVQSYRQDQNGAPQAT